LEKALLNKYAYVKLLFYITLFVSAMRPVVLIPARRASTRLPNKPLADIAGLPMIAHVYQRALDARIGDVFVATDDAEIAWAVEKEGGRAVITAEHHPSGSDRIWEALQNLDPDGKYDTIINVQGDLPTLDPSIVSAILVPLEQDARVDISTLVCEIHDEADKTNPAVVKPIIAWNNEIHASGLRMGQALYFTRATAPWGDGALYHHIGMYGYRRDALQSFVSLPPSPLELREKLEQLRALEAGMMIGVAEVQTIPLGVDTQEQLEQARELLK
jgi:3-deoxy-manno-octulosonate cytidylyltransferase (CMP-KDO synthetase)